MARAGQRHRHANESRHLGFTYLLAAQSPCEATFASKQPNRADHFQLQNSKNPPGYLRISSGLVSAVASPARLSGDAARLGVHCGPMVVFSTQARQSRDRIWLVSRTSFLQRRATDCVICSTRCRRGSRIFTLHRDPMCARTCLLLCRLSSARR